MNFLTAQIRSKVHAQIHDSAMLQQGISKFKALSKREQILLSVLSISFVVYLFFTLIWQPIKVAEENAEKRLKDNYLTYNLLVNNAESIAMTQGNQAGGLRDRTAEELQTLAISTMRRQKIVAQRLNLDGDSRLQVWVENTPYATIAKLLTVLEKNKVTIYNVQFVSRDVGMVDMRLTLD